jgi:hypothetical protein
MALTDSPPTTTNYSITLPEVGSDRNNWGNVLNAALESTASQVKTVDDVQGDPADSSTPSLAYQLTGAVTSASNAETDAATAVNVAVQMVNQYLVAVVSAVNTLDTEVGDTSTSGTVAYDANQAKLDAASAKTTAEGLV